MLKNLISFCLIQILVWITACGALKSNEGYLGSNHYSNKFQVVDDTIPCSEIHLNRIMENVITKVPTLPRHTILSLVIPIENNSSSAQFYFSDGDSTYLFNVNTKHIDARYADRSFPVKEEHLLFHYKEGTISNDDYKFHRTDKNPALSSSRESPVQYMWIADISEDLEVICPEFTSSFDSIVNFYVLDINGNFIKSFPFINEEQTSVSVSCIRWNPDNKDEFYYCIIGRGLYKYNIPSGKSTLMFRNCNDKRILNFIFLKSSPWIVGDCSINGAFYQNSKNASKLIFILNRETKEFKFIQPI